MTDNELREAILQEAGEGDLDVVDDQATNEEDA
jgi:hypothetical protein